MRYQFGQIEQRWQQYWADNHTFRTLNPGDEGFDAEKPRFYVLDMFPYPSGVGLHVGHPLGYIATDVVARYKKMCGYNVLHPMGYDAFGLPAEQFAVEHGVHPRVTTEKNIANMTRQLKRLGLGYDWDRCLATTEPDYYRWTQWIFLQLYNSWFDPITQTARPIEQLISALNNDQFYLTIDHELQIPPAEGMEGLAGQPVGAIQWAELTPQQQSEFIDRHRLAYMDEVDVNWCPALGTVLANEEVTNEGRSERGNHPVYRRPLKQWMLQITAFAERLLADLDLVDWPEPIKLMQRNWIGRSQGAMVDFAVADSDQVIGVYTTRPDTLFGATYMVLAPEHPLVELITTDERRDAVEHYRVSAAGRSDMDRMSESKEKTGEFTGGFAINPVNDEKIPIWIADYVLTGYGTGAIMAVPAHDERDFEFAKAFHLPIRAVVMPDDEWLQQSAKGLPELETLGPKQLRGKYIQHAGDFPDAFVGLGQSVNSAGPEVSLDGLDTEQAKQSITQWLKDKGLGRFEVQYKLRDWLFSRQRYWGEPFPILHGPDGQTIAVDEANLPVVLPDMEDFKPSASDDPAADVQTPLSRAPDAWKYLEIDGVRYTRELNTMPQWAGSCWYYLRFIDPKNSDRFVGKESELYWMTGKAQGDEDNGHKQSRLKAAPNGGIDLYVGGAEHAVLHLLYARFWHKVLFDLGHVSTPEPFGRLFNQGYIQAYAYTDERGIYVDADKIDEKSGKFYFEDKQVTREFGKMGKSLKNAVTPDEICEQYGCDTMRLYEMYLGPLDQSKVWNTRDIAGSHRFLQRLWRNFMDEETGELLIIDEPADDDLRKKLHKTIKRVTDAMESMSFNVAIAALIELNNDLVQRKTVPLEVAKPMLLCLAPLAPHICEELWHCLMFPEHASIADQSWPAYDQSLLVEDNIEYPIQINGKVRGKVTVPADADDKTIEDTALAEEKVQAAIEGKTVRKVIIIKGRMVNVVAN